MYYNADCNKVFTMLYYIVFGFLTLFVNRYSNSQDYIICDLVADTVDILTIEMKIVGSAYATYYPEYSNKDSVQYNRLLSALTATVGRLVYAVYTGM